jgi:hypothetical protein
MPSNTTFSGAGLACSTFRGLGPLLPFWRTWAAPARPSKFPALPDMVLSVPGLLFPLESVDELRLILFARMTRSFRGNNGGNFLSFNNNADSTEFSF